ncbi:MAG: hypothetical protein DRJ64_10020, partial [Thermoprotei archaeon]
MKKLLMYFAILFLLSGSLFAGVLDLHPGKWLIVTKAVDGPSDYDLDYLSSVVASAALTDGHPSVLSISNTTSLANDIWHADYIDRYNSPNALVVGQDISSISGVSQMITLNSASAGRDQAIEIATTVWQSS